VKNNTRLGGVLFARQTGSFDFNANSIHAVFIPPRSIIIQGAEFMNKHPGKAMSLGILSFTILTGAVMATPAFALEENFSGNIGITSNYIFRGISESGDDAAVFGGLDYQLPAGFYAGTWLSSLGGDEELGYEIDFYAGFAGDLGEAGTLAYDVGYIYYAYPAAESGVDADFGEVFVQLSFLNVYGMVNLITNADDSDAEGTLSYEAGAEFPLTPFNGTSIGTNIGYVDFDADSDFDYLWWSVYLSRETRMGDFNFIYVQNDTDDDFGDSSDPRFYVTFEVTL